MIIHIKDNKLHQQGDDLICFDTEDKEHFVKGFFDKWHAVSIEFLNMEKTDMILRLNKESNQDEDWI